MPLTTRTLFRILLTQLPSRHELIPSSWVLLDSQLTVSVFKNPNFLTYIRRSNSQLKVHTNGGTQVRRLSATSRILGHSGTIPTLWPTLLRITFDCKDLFSKSGAGTGNFISAFYGLRLAARTYQDVDVVLECPDAVQEQTNLIILWLMGSFPGGASPLMLDQVKSTNMRNYIAVPIPT